MPVYTMRERALIDQLQMLNELYRDYSPLSPDWNNKVNAAWDRLLNTLADQGNPRVSHSGLQW